MNFIFIRQHSANIHPDDLTFVTKTADLQSWNHDWHVFRVTFPGRRSGEDAAAPAGAAQAPSPPPRETTAGRASSSHSVCPTGTERCH